MTLRHAVRPLVHACIAALAASLFAGCISFAQPAPTTQRYMLDVTRTDRPADAPFSIHLEVKQFHASAAFAGRKFVRRIGDGSEVEVDYYHEFLVPPAVTLTEITRQWLADGKRFQAVHGAGSTVSPDWTLDVDILELSGDERGGAREAVVDIHASLLDATTRKMLLNERYTHREAITDGTATELVGGWNRATAAVLSRLEEDLRRIAGR